MHNRRQTVKVRHKIAKNVVYLPIDGLFSHIAYSTKNTQPASKNLYTGKIRRGIQKMGYFSILIDKLKSYDQFTTDFFTFLENPQKFSYQQFIKFIFAERPCSWLLNSTNLT
jgi:hypothetical protein